MNVLKLRLWKLRQRPYVALGVSLLLTMIVTGCGGSAPDAPATSPSGPADATSTTTIADGARSPTPSPPPEQVARAAPVAGVQPSRNWIIETVDDSPNDVGKYVTIALDGRSQLHVAYFDDTTNSLKYAHLSGEGRGGPEVVAGGGNAGQHASIALSPKDQSRHISYYVASPGANLGHAWQPAMGDGWTLSIASQTGTVGQLASIDIGHDGVLHGRLL